MKGFKGKIALGLAVTLVFSGISYQGKEQKSVEAAEEYQLVWSDEFDGTSLNDSNWNIEVNGNGGGNNELQYYTNRTQNIEVSNGTLKIHALKEKYGNKNYTSGRITTQNKKIFKFGRIEAKMKLPRFKGAWPAFWMLGNNISSVGWPKCGEMDIMEAINEENNVYANLHWYHSDHNADTQGTAYNVGDRTAWHTYAMEWDANTTKFYVDNILYQTYDISDSNFSEFRKEQFIIFNLAIGGIWPGYNIDDTAFPSKSTMEVDYVRVYQKQEETTTAYEGPTVSVNQDSVKEFKGAWTPFFGSSINWIESKGSITQNSTTDLSAGYTANITDAGHVAGDSIWSVQGNLENIPFYAGNTYTFKVTLLSNVDKKVFVKVTDEDQSVMAGEILDLKANVPYNYTTQVEIPSDFDSTVSLKFGLGKTEGDTIDDNSALTVKVSNVSFNTTALIPDPAYQPMTETKTQSTNLPTKNETTIKQEVITKDEAATKQEVTTKDGGVSKDEVTTGTEKTAALQKSTEEDQAGEFLKKCGTAKIKVSVKKKSAKKIKITLKKALKAVDGYEVRVYKTRKNARKNKKVFVKARTKKNTKSFKISHKKLKNKKKLFLRVRGYKKIGKKIIFSKKWSVTKKVKIK